MKLALLCALILSAPAFAQEGHDHVGASGMHGGGDHGMPQQNERYGRHDGWYAWPRTRHG